MTGGVRRVPEHVARALLRTEEEWVEVEEAQHQVERSVCETARGHRWEGCVDRAGREFYVCEHCGLEVGRAPVGVA